jgi:hypothetical protein
MRHALSVENGADPDIPDLLTLHCTCGEYAKGRLIDVLVMWADWHLRTSDPEYDEGADMEHLKGEQLRWPK